MRHPLRLQEPVVETSLLDLRLTQYEQKYGLSSEEFYTALHTGQLSRLGNRDEIGDDFKRWQGIYELWRWRVEDDERQLSLAAIRKRSTSVPAHWLPLR